MSYAQEPVTFSAINTAEISLPGTFQYAVCSAWLLPDSGTRGWSVGLLDGSPFSGIQFSTGYGVGGAQVQIGNGTFIGIDPSEQINFTVPGFADGVWQHWLWSIDTVNGVFQLYVNDVPATISSTEPPSYVPIVVSAPAGPGFSAAFGTYNTPSNCQGDVWFGIPGSFFDLTDVNNRRKFSDSAGAPIDLGVHGALPLGTPPALYLTVRSGSAIDFLTNSGAGAGTFSALTQPLSFCGSIPPPPASTFYMDNVVVTSLGTESPCTALNFTTPPPVAQSPSLGLRWSDTRGQTWGNAVPQQFSTDPLSSYQWNRTGYARDRVFELFWSAAFKTALNGAFIDVRNMKS